MTTTMTRQQLVGQLTALCCVSCLFGFFFFFSFYDWRRGDPRYWADAAILILLVGTFVFAFRRFLNSFQPSASTH
jgi:hypothetical protein